jgi:glycosyltransferase involved in cell wall biosynthesis
MLFFRPRPQVPKPVRIQTFTAEAPSIQTHRPMQILHIIASLDPASGTGEGVTRLIQQLARLGHAQDVICLDVGDDPWIVGSSVTIFSLGRRHRGPKKLKRWLPWRRYQYSSQLVPWLKKNAHRYDAVIVNELWNYCALAARRAFSGTPVRYFVYTHGKLDPWFRRTAPLKTAFKQVSWWFSEGPLLAGARAVLFTTEEERMLAQNAFWPYRCREAVVGYGTVDVVGDPETQIAEFRSRLPRLGDGRYLLYLGRIDVKKGCDLLVEAFARTVAKEPALHLVMAGPDQFGLVAKLKKKAARLGVADHIHWPGRLGGDAKWGAFRACEAFIMPSHGENFGIAIAEAMACSKPVLITNKVNIWPQVEQGGGGLVANDDLSGIESLFERFLSLPEAARSRMSEAARVTFLTHFTLEKNVSRMMLVIAQRP